MEIWIIFLSCRYVLILYVVNWLTNTCPHLLVVNCFSFLPIYFCLVPPITSFHVSILMFLLSPPNTLIPPHCLCPVPHTPLLWIVNMALSHGGQRKERRNKKPTEEGKKGWARERWKLKGKVTARDKNMQGDSEARNTNVRDNSRKRKRGILNHHQQGKYCFEIGHIPCRGCWLQTASAAPCRNGKGCVCVHACVHPSARCKAQTTGYILSPAISLYVSLIIPLPFWHCGQKTIFLLFFHFPSSSLCLYMMYLFLSPHEPPLLFSICLKNGQLVISSLQRRKSQPPHCYPQSALTVCLSLWADVSFFSQHVSFWTYIHL